MSGSPQNASLSPTDTDSHKRARVALEHGIHRLFSSTDEPWIIHDASLVDEGRRGSLCGICRQINFDWLLHNELDRHVWPLEKSGPRWSYINQTNRGIRVEPDADLGHPLCVQIPPDPGWHRFPRIPLGFLIDIAERDTCPFCRLVTRGVYNALSLSGSGGLLTALVPGYGVRPVSGSVGAADAICSLSNVLKGRDHARRADILSLRIWIHGRRGFSRVRAVDVQELSTGYVPWLGRYVDPVVNSDLLRSWLRIEESRLAPSQHSFPSTAEEQNFRLIDVADNCVVKATMSWRYLALSYVWGTQASLRNTTALESQLSQPGGLKKHYIPRTIGDAITLTRRLGERYLWVDSLCIIQDDAAAKQSQILAMHQVYASALATIIAASGENADSGLAGVRPGTRTPFQHVETIRGITMGNRWDVDTLTSTTPRDLLNCAEKTVWMSRAWTLQELILSNRAIFFMENAVWYLSRDHILKEDVYEDITTMGRDMAENLMRILGTPPKPVDDVNATLERYSYAVRLYSMREISHHSDALNAFAAMLSLFHSGFPGGYLAGLPIIHLDRLLLWLPDATITGRTDQAGTALFPSCSWAGWSGRIEMLDSRPRFPRVKWLCPELGALASEVSLGGMSERTLDQLDNAKRLEFETLAAKLPLRPGRGAIWRMKSASNRHLDPEICPYYVDDITQRGDMAGIVYIHVDGITPGDEIAFDYELIVISRSTHHRLPNKGGGSRPPDDDADLAQWAQSFSPDEWQAARKAYKTISVSYAVDLDWGMYDVLVILWEGGVARRVGAGRVFAEAFHFAKPVRKKIVLE